MPHPKRFALWLCLAGSIAAAGCGPDPATAPFQRGDRVAILTLDRPGVVLSRPRKEGSLDGPWTYWVQYANLHGELIESKILSSDLAPWPPGKERR